MKKKILALLLASAMVFEGTGILQVQAVPTEMESALEMELDTRYQVNLEEGDEVYYKFIPDTDGAYAFESSAIDDGGNYDTYGVLYDVNGNDLISNDDGGEGTNFLIEYMLEAGKTYYIKAHGYSGEANFNLSVKKIPWYIENNNIYATVIYNEENELTAEVAGSTEELTYQWYYYGEYEDDCWDYVKIEGATDATYTLIGAKNMPYQYKCEITDGVLTRYVNAYITLDTNLDVVNSNQYVTVEYGKSKELSVKATGGAGKLSYQWYYEEKYEDEYGDICRRYAKIEGATEDTYTVTGAKDMSTTYKCEVTDGIVTRDVYVSITLDTGLEVEIDEQYIIVEYGKSKELSVKATGGAGKLSYQWYYYENYYDEEFGSMSFRYVKIEGATEDTYTVTGAKEMSSEYMCRVSDGVITRDLYLYTTLDTGLEVEEENPYVTVEYGKSKELEVKATGGAGDLSYKWYSYEEYESGAYRYVEIEGATQTTYTVTGAKDMPYKYKCEITDGVVTKEVYVNIELDTGLEIESYEKNVTVEYGKSKELKVKATGGVGEISYQWYKEQNYEDEYGDISRSYVKIEGATEATYTVTGTKDISYTYKCEITDGVVTKEVYVNIELDTGLEIENSEQYITVEYGKSKELEVKATGGVGEISYQWYYSEKYEDEWGDIYSHYVKIKGATEATYTVTGTKDMSSTYKCKVTDGVVTKDTYVYITLDTGLELDVYEENINVAYGSSKTLTAEASGGVSTLTYQWYKWDEYEDEYILIEGATTKNYTINGTPDVNEAYKCEVSDGIIKKYYYAYVTLNTGLVLEQYYKDEYVLYGEEKTLKVNATGGIGELTYQWYYLDTNEGEYVQIEGATNNQYTVIADENMYEWYKCIVKDSYVSKTCEFEVVMDTDLEIDCSSYVYIPEGIAKILSLNAIGGVGTLSYSWYYYDEDKEDFVQIEGANSDGYTIIADDSAYDTYKGVVTDGISTLERIFYIHKISVQEFTFNNDIELHDGYNCIKICGIDKGAYKICTNGVSYYEEAELFDANMNRIAYDYNGDLNMNYIFDESKTYYLMVYVNKADTDSLTLKLEGIDFLATYKGESNSITAEYGDDIELEVNAVTDTGALTYQWFKLNENTGVYDEILDATAAVYSMEATEEVAREYMCRVSNGEKDIDVVFYVRVTSDLTVNVNGDCGEFIVPYAENVEVIVTATGGIGELTYQWYYYDNNIDEYVLVENVTTNKLVLEGNNSMYNQYKCIVSDVLTKKSVYINAKLDSGLVLYKSPQTYYTLQYGKKADMEVIASSKDRNITYVWEYFDYDLEKYVTIQSVNSNKYTILADENSKEMYRCTVSDGLTYKIQYFYFEYTGTIVDISKDCTTTLSYTSIVEDGLAKKPSVKVMYGSEELVYDEHYTVEYKNNVNPGTASVVIKGIGKYKGEIIKTFIITAKAVIPPKQPVVVKPITTSISKATLTLDKKSYVYDGKEKKPFVKVVVGGKTLVNGTDYTVSYTNNKNIGKATVTVTGKGKYVGSIKTTFDINVKVRSTYTVGAYKYKITNKSEVAFVGLKKATTKKVVIAGTVKIGGKTFKVTSIADGALQKKTKVTSVIIGATVKKIGKNAFNGCKKLKTITIKSTKLSSVGKNALKGINSKVTIKVPSKKFTAYKKLLKGKGQSSKVKIKK